MKTLYTLMNDRINKPYDLVVMQYKELKELILKDSGLTLREMQLRFDSAAYSEIEEKEFNEEEVNALIKADAIKNIKIENKKHLKARYKEVLKDLSRYQSEMNGLHKSIEIQGHLVKSKQSYFARLTASINRLNLELDGVTNEDEYVNKYWGNESLLTNQNSPTYVHNLMHIYDIEELTEKIENKDKGFSMFYSWTDFTNVGAAYEKYKEENKARDLRFKSYSVNRVRQAEVGIEVYPFAIEIYNGKHILLDGFNRLFGNDFQNIEKEILVKVYKDLSEPDYTEVLIELNDWKIKTGFGGRGYFDLNFKELFLDRGVKASLFIKYGLTVDSYVLRLLPYTKNMVEALRYSLSILEESNKHLEITKNHIYQTNMAFTILELGFYNVKECESLDSNNVLTYVNSKEFKKHIKKIEGYSTSTYVGNYLTKSVYKEFENFINKA